MTLNLGGLVRMAFVWIPPGSFDMGSPDDEEGRSGTEGPVHRVTIDQGFWMAKYEVTQGQYQQLRGSNPSGFKGAKNPVEKVNWHNAQGFCEKLNEKLSDSSQFKTFTCRLPTEAEWEKAARGELEGKLYPWGDTFDGERVNFCDRNCETRYANQDYDDGYKNTAPVGSYAPNGYGLYDMAGNVWEWLADWYDEDYYANSPASNPGGPTSGSLGTDRAILRNKELEV